MRSTEGLGIGRMFASPEYKMALGYAIQRINASLSITIPTYVVSDNFLVWKWRKHMALIVQQRLISAVTKEPSSTLSLLATEYQNNLEDIEALVKVSSANTQGYSTPTQYYCLINSRITEHLNDAGLCIRTIHCEKDAVYPEDLTGNDLKAIEDTVRNTIAFLERLVQTFLPNSRPAHNNLEGTSAFLERLVQTFLPNSRPARNNLDGTSGINKKHEPGGCTGTHDRRVVCSNEK
ncbi:hypothetical protein BU25DRAFT_424151 [Macroventuria anomochaeta]|uniref:Uncharacterized protein n=1 Tax=Macroventuria anomochaeta TaxID=301207 RepID=A0ACB6RU49_9PLEO|nr:uncharacterized protein BU25DRAFT_424151 [Macroventuria anomochaeta]KAF2624367.1 hypothetical protein BU25DRAFT_424151 [Macroventuria anomochaeta]